MLKPRLDHSRHVAKGFGKGYAYNASLLRSNFTHAAHARPLDQHAGCTWREIPYLGLYWRQKRMLCSSRPQEVFALKEGSETTENGKKMDFVLEQELQLCCLAIRALYTCPSIKIHTSDNDKPIENNIGNVSNDSVGFEMSSVLKKRRKAMNKHKRKKRAKKQRYKTAKRKR